MGKHGTCCCSCWVSVKTSTNQTSPLGVALRFSLGIHDTQLLLVVATFTKCKITHRPFFNVDSCAMQ